MIWRVIRPQFWTLDRRVRQTKRIWIILIVTIPLFIAEHLLNSISLGALSPDSSVVGIVFLGIIGLTLMMLLDINNMLYQLFESSELDVLMVNPVPLHTIFTLKLMQCGRTLIIFGPIWIALLILAGLERDVPVLNLILIGLSMASVLVIIAALVMALVMLVCWVVPARRLRSASIVIFALMPLALIFVQGDIAAWFVEEPNFQSALAERLYMLSPWISLPILAAALALGFAYMIFSRSFHEGRARYQIVYPSGRPKNAALSPRWIVKEWRIMRRDTRLMMSLTQPLVISLLLLMPVIQGSGALEAWQPIAFWMLVVFSVQVIVTLPFMAIEILKREGRSFALIRTHPIGAARIMRMKFWVVLIPQMSIWTLYIIGIGIIYHFAIWQIGLLIAVVGIGLALSITIALALAAHDIDFQAPSVPRGTQLSILALNVLCAISLLLLITWSIVYVFPENNALTVLDLLNISVSGTLWLPAAALSVGLIVLASLGWLRAVRRLNAWEVV